MDASKLKCPPFSKEEAAMIKSTRIRVGRNLGDYPLGPGVSDAQRKEIESKAIQATQKFDGDLKRKYYALNSLSEKDRQ